LFGEELVYYFIHHFPDVIVSRCQTVILSCCSLVRLVPFSPKYFEVLSDRLRGPSSFALPTVNPINVLAAETQCQILSVSKSALPNMVFLQYFSKTD